MSLLKGFKKNINRAGTTLMQRTGAVDRTEDSEFNEEYERFRTLDKKSNKLSKVAKEYLDSMRAVTAAQNSICQLLHNFYSDANPMGDNVIAYKKTIENLDEHVRTELDPAFRTAVLDPLIRFCSYFPAVQEAIKRRQKKALDYDAQRSKVRKLVDKPSEDPQRLPRAEQEANLAREMYENLNSILVEDLPKLVALRVPYLDPTFEALVKSELQFSQTSYEQFDALRPSFPNDLDMSEYGDPRLENILQQMRSLTICGNF